MSEDPVFKTQVTFPRESPKKVMISGDSIYRPANQYTVYESKIKELDIECIFEEDENIWHVKVYVWHSHNWDEIYTDSGFKKEISELVFGIIMPAEKLFEKTIDGSILDYRLEYTTSGDQYNRCACLEPAEQSAAREIAQWVKKQIAEDDLNRV